MLSEDDLLCPITLELLNDPVQVPCCGKTVSRAPLIIIGNTNRTCPMCRQPFPDSFDAATAPPNRMLADIVQAFIAKKQNIKSTTANGAAAAVASTPSSPWTASLIPVNNNNRNKNKNEKTVAQLHISCSKIPVEAQPSPTLCLVVNDSSGSMAGNAWRQVVAATRHILAMSHTNPMVQTRIITYSSTANVIRTSGRRLNDILADVDGLRAGGGTNFSAAFQAIVATLKEIKESASVDLHTASIRDVSIMFLTDGQATEGNRNDLPATLKRLLEPLKMHYDSLTVHAVGFSKDCDQNLLEALRKVGFARRKNDDNNNNNNAKNETNQTFDINEGMFRYAQPGDDDDLLCSKLTSLYEISARAASLPIQIEFFNNNERAKTASTRISFISNGQQQQQQQKSHHHKLNVSADQSATLSVWVEVENDNIDDDELNKLHVKITSNDLFTENANDPSITLPVEVISYDKNGYLTNQVSQQWLMKLVDGVAENILELVNNTNNNPDMNTRQLTIALLEHRINFIHAHLESAESKNQCNILQEQLLTLKRGGAVVVGRLNDLRFSSAFSQLAPTKNNAMNNNNATNNHQRNNNVPPPRATPAQPQPLALTYEELIPRLSYQSRNHSPLHKLICAVFPRRTTKEAENAIANASLHQLLYDTCPEGNSILHCCAFGGHDGLIQLIFDKIKRADSAQLNAPACDTIRRACTQPNKANETPITLAIKRRGFHSTLELMLTECCSKSSHHQASTIIVIIADNRLPSLKRFCIDHGFPRTAGIIATKWEQIVLAANKSAAASSPSPSSSRHQGASASASVPTFVLTKPDKNISKDYALFTWNQIPEKAKMFSSSSTSSTNLDEIITSWIEVALEKQLDEPILNFFFSSASPGFLLSNNEINNNNNLLSFDIFCDFCFPPKADHPQVDFYLNRFKMILAVLPGLKSSRDAKSGDTILHKAVDKGNLPFVEYILTNNARNNNNNNNLFNSDLLESRNDLGNTPLYLACAKRYPCIIDSLLNHGADPDAANLKGNVPLSCVAQMGPAKVAETLLAAGASVTALNKNGDSLLLLCCRNGQHEVLRLLLSQAPKKLIKHRAHIDGFDVLFASVEADKVDCLRVLLHANAGAVSLKEVIEAKTTDDNEIIAGASLLHLAAYYNRSASAEFLLNFIVDSRENNTRQHQEQNLVQNFANAKDKTGSTALHIAVLRNHVNMVSLLRRPAWKANANIRDAAGVTAAAYAKEKSPEIYSMLVDSLLQPALTFARGINNNKNSGDSLEACCQVWKNLAGIPGFVTAAALSDSLCDETSGRTLLATSIVHCNVPAIKMFLEIGCNYLISQSNDNDEDNDQNETSNPFSQINSIFWAKWMKNARILNIFEDQGIDVDELAETTCSASLKRLNDANRRFGLLDKNVLFLGGGGIAPSSSTSSITNGSSLNERMNLFTEFVLADSQQQNSDDDVQENDVVGRLLMISNNNNNNNDNNNSAINSNWIIPSSSTTTASASTGKKANSQGSSVLDRVSQVSMWDAKIRVCEIIASSNNNDNNNNNNSLSPSELFALCLYSREPACSREIVRNIGRVIIQNKKSTESPPPVDPTSMGFFSSLWKAIEKLPPFVSTNNNNEVYCGFEAGAVNRQSFQLGAEVAAFNIFSCTTSWPVAAGVCSAKNNENTSSTVVDFDSSNGTIFILHPKSASNNNNNKVSTFHLVGSNSLSPSDCEGIFTPGIRFKVVRWMKGDVVALGQPNIRDHTFALKTQESRDLYSGTKRPLIIEMDQI